MHDVVSLGSVNVDRVARVTADTLAALESEYDWFPAAGETVSVESIPSSLDEYVDETDVGGKGGNQAVAAARAGADTAFLGAVGADHEQFGVLETLAGYGVDVSRVRVTEGPTGTAYVFVDETGENRIPILAGANDAVTPAYATDQLDVLGAAGAVCLQNEIPVETADHVLSTLDDRPPGERPIVVFNPAPAAGAEPLLGHPSLSVVVVNESEAAALADELAATPATVVETRGGESVSVDSTADDGRDDASFTLTPPSVSPVDTTGAGDTFVGYLAAGLAAGDPIRAAVERAVVAASLSTEAAGVHAAVPSADTVASALPARFDG
jgi:ribokinase